MHDIDNDGEIGYGPDGPEYNDPMTDGEKAVMFIVAFVASVVLLFAFVNYALQPDVKQEIINE